MAEEGKSKYGTGFFVRLVILLLLLGAVGYGYYQDRVGIPATIQSKLDEIDARKDTEDANMSGIKMEEIHQILNREPDSKFEDEKNGYVVETYNYKRGLPFLKGGNSLKIVYKEDSFLKYLLNKEYVASNVETKQDNFGLPPKEERVPVGFGGGGKAPKKKAKKGDDKKQSDEAKSDEAKSDDKSSDDAKSDDAKAGDDTKSDDDSKESGEEKKDDGSSEEKKDDGN